MKVDQNVLMQSKKCIRGFWKLAKIKKLIQGSDGHVRGAKQGYLWILHLPQYFVSLGYVLPSGRIHVGPRQRKGTVTVA